MRRRSRGDGSEPFDLAQRKDLFPKDDAEANLRLVDHEA